MRWLVGWSGVRRDGGPARDDADHPAELPPVHPVGAQVLWHGPDPLWAVGDWRPDEIRLVSLDPDTRLAVLGCCGATDDELRRGLVAARAGALRHLTAWPGSYTAVARVGRRTTVTTDLAGARPVFHTSWSGGTAYATAALPLADLIETQLDIPYLAALLACPDSPEALGEGTPYQGVSRVPPGHALILREGRRGEVVSYEPAASLAVAAPQQDAEDAVAAVRDALIEAVRVRLAAPRHAPTADGPGGGGAAGRTARGSPAPGLGADLSGGSASATLALLAAGLPGVPGTLVGAPGTQAGERLLAVTFNDLATPLGPPSATLGEQQSREAELERARAIGSDPRLHHLVVPGGEEALPFADLAGGPLTDEPAPSLVTAERDRVRLAAGSADHLTGHGARQVLDAHPARLADLLLDRRRRHLLRPITALAAAEGAGSRALLVPLAVYRAARRLARTGYRDGMAEAARALRERRFPEYTDGPVGASLAALSWCRPGPAARWLTGETLAAVSVRLAEAAERPGAAGQRPGARRARAALARHAADHRIREQATELPDQRLHSPFLDNQVVRACQELPVALRVRPGTRAAVLRTVLAGAGVTNVPPGWGATTHATRTAEVRCGLRRFVDELTDLFAEPLLADAGLVAAASVRGALHGAARGEPLPVDGLAQLVAVEVWLRRLMARRGTCWAGPAAPRQRAAAAGVVAGSRPALG